MDEKIIAALLGLVAGVVGSLIAPWVQWAVEKRRSTLAYRADTIRRWREAVDGDPRGFLNTSQYASLRPHLKKEVLSRVEDHRTHIAAGGRGGDAKKQMLLDEIARIEREWGLL